MINDLKQSIETQCFITLIHIIFLTFRFYNKLNVCFHWRKIKQRSTQNYFDIEIHLFDDIVRHTRRELKHKLIRYFLWHEWNINSWKNRGKKVAARLVSSNDSFFSYTVSWSTIYLILIKHKDFLILFEFKKRRKKHFTNFIETLSRSTFIK